MRILLLYNVAAGRGTVEDRLDEVADVFRRRGHEVVPRGIVFGENPFDGCETVDMAVVAGGDGTLNYTVNRMKEKGLDIVLGVIPAGTANDFAGAVGMSGSLVEAAEQIADGRERRLDCGWVNGLYFVNVFSFGLFTTTSQHTSDDIKHRFGKLAYIFEGLKELRSKHGLALHFSTDEGEFDSNALMTLIFNGETAGGFRIARDASVCDGMFDGLILENRNFFSLCRDIIIFQRGGNPKSVRKFRSRNIRITSSAVNIPTDVDGQKGAEFPLDIRCVAGGLRVVCPEQRG